MSVQQKLAQQKPAQHKPAQQQSSQESAGWLEAGAPDLVVGAVCESLHAPDSATQHARAVDLPRLPKAPSLGRSSACLSASSRDAPGFCRESNEASASALARVGRPGSRFSLIRRSSLGAHALPPPSCPPPQEALPTLSPHRTQSPRTSSENTGPSADIDGKESDQMQASLDA